MLTNLWLSNLFFLANILITLAFLTYSWIYIDAYLLQKRFKDLLRTIGGILVSIFFVVNILTFNSGYTSLGRLLVTFCFTFGLLAIFYGNLLEPVPGLPDEAIDTKKKGVNYISIISFISIAVCLSILNSSEEYGRIGIILNAVLFFCILGYILFFYKKFLEPNTRLEEEESNRRQRNMSLFLVIIPVFTSVLLAILITIQNYKKVFKGLSKEFRYLGMFWTVFSIFSIIQLLSFLGDYYFVFIDNFTRQFSLLWILSQILLLICTVLMFRWVAVFISFRIVARLFLYVWQISIFLTVALASTYSIFIITSSESQVNDFLAKNANLIQFNLDQIKTNNVDVLNILGKNQKLIQAINDNDSSKIQDEIGDFVNSNSFLDKVQVASNTGDLIYDSENTTDEGISLNDNDLIKKTIFSRGSFAGYAIEKTGIDTLVLNYQFTHPVIDSQGKMSGVITTIKRLNDNYLELLKRQTNQELVIYINEKRSASTILESDGLSKLQNLPLVIDGQISANGDVSFYKGRILTTPYYFAVVSLKDISGNILGNFVIGTQQIVLIELTKNSLFNLFVLSLILTMVSTIPSYFLAKNLRKNLSV